MWRGYTKVLEYLVASIFSMASFPRGPQFYFYFSSFPVQVRTDGSVLTLRNNLMDVEVASYLFLGVPVSLQLYKYIVKEIDIVLVILVMASYL
jgi:hypothetical protein